MDIDGFRNFLDSFPQEHKYSDLEVIKLYQHHSNMRVKELAEKTGKSINEIYRILKRFDVSPSRQKTNQHLVVSYSNQGYKVSEIANLTGYTERNVRYILSKNKIEE